MARHSPLNPHHSQSEALMGLYGQPQEGVQIVETFGATEIEYAAIRKDCVILDEPYRGVVELTGADRADFLNRMVTQELAGIGPMQMKRSFWLNRKGRIDADLRIVHLSDRTLLEMDVHAAANTASSLEEFVFTEDVQLQDLTEQTHRLGLHGPGAHAILEAAADAYEPLEPGGAACIEIDGRKCTVFRDDTTGQVGLELIVLFDEVCEVYEKLLSVARIGDEDSDKPRLRPAGWHAFNIARAEAGTPLFNVDFGTDTLPHETGVLRDRVSFTKGCYLGQEVVARMEALGAPKKILVALRPDLTDLDEADVPQPVTADPVFMPDDVGGKSVGAITTSSFAPMLGSAMICFAMVKHGVSEAGTKLVIQMVDGVAIPAEVQATLVFWNAS